MSKVQTRRTVSVSRQTWDSIKERAAELKISASEYVTRLVRADIPTLAPQIHTRALAAGEQRLVVHVPNATAEPPVRMPTIVARPVPPAGSFCASCVDRPATHYDHEKYPMCDACADEHPRSGRYSFEGGKADATLSPGGDGNKRTPRRATGAR